MSAENPADVIEAALLRMWDDGNATGLDGWVGPDRGSEPDDYAIEVRRKRVDRELDKLAHLLADPADRDEVTFISEEARMRASELDPQAIIRNLIQDKQTIAKLVTKNRERAERAEAEVAELEHRLGDCTCGPWHPDMDGPAEECPRHGRCYSDWVDAVDAKEAQIAELRATVERCESVLGAWGIGDAEEGDTFDSPFSEAIRQSGAWRFERDITKALDPGRRPVDG